MAEIYAVFLLLLAGVAVLGAFASMVVAPLALEKVTNSWYSFSGRGWEESVTMVSEV